MFNHQRADRIGAVLKEAGLGGLVCALPKNVLMLSGYWPVIGTSLAIVFEDGSAELIVPEDEKDLADRGWASHVQTFKPATLDQLTSVTAALAEPFRQATRTLNGKLLGIEEAENSEPTTYAAMNLYGRALSQTIRATLPGAKILAADELLETLRSVKTGPELEAIRRACSLTRLAFEEAVRELRPGLTEFEAAENFRFAFKRNQPAITENGRAEAFFWAMSGENSALAHGAYARSRSKKVSEDDLILIHCNTCVDGYWTDVTRTFSLSDVNDRRKDMYRAIFTARQEALRTIAPGRKASEVDSAARSVLERLGFAQEFKHSTGHGVGFGAISPNARPRIHPRSDDVLERGMVFNVEPAIYINGYGGIRHCDMVAVTHDGCELLTDFYSQPEDLVLTPAPRSSAQSA